MKKLLFSLIVGVAALVTQSASAEQVYNVATQEAWIQSGQQASIPLPAQATFDFRFGYIVRPAFVTRFIVRVGPNSSARGCAPAGSGGGAIVFTGILSTQPGLLPTEQVGGPTASQARPGYWNYEFSVNGGFGAPVQAIQPAFQRTQFPAQCGYDVLYTGQTAAQAAAAVAGGGTSRNATPQAAAAPAAEDANKEHREIKVDLKDKVKQY